MCDHTMSNIDTSNQTLKKMPVVTIHRNVNTVHLNATILLIKQKKCEDVLTG